MRCELPSAAGPPGKPLIVGYGSVLNGSGRDREPKAAYGQAAETREVLVVFGTRPEAVKLAPVVAELRRRIGQARVRVVVTGQHREMLDQVLRAFDLRPDIDLNL